MQQGMQHPTRLRSQGMVSRLTLGVVEIAGYTAAAGDFVFFSAGANYEVNLCAQGLLPEARVVSVEAFPAGTVTTAERRVTVEVYGYRSQDNAADTVTLQCAYRVEAWPLEGPCTLGFGVQKGAGNAAVQCSVAAMLDMGKILAYDVDENLVLVLI